MEMEKISIRGILSPLHITIYSYELGRAGVSWGGSDMERKGQVGEIKQRGDG